MDDQIITSSLPALSVLLRNLRNHASGRGPRPGSASKHQEISLKPLPPPARESDEIYLVSKNDNRECASTE